MRDRVLLSVQNRRLHRNPLRLHRSSERTGIYLLRRKRNVSERHVEPPSEHQIQRNLVQNAAAAIFSEEGIKECQENLNYYKNNAKVIADTLTELQIPFYGGIHSPYIWFECPNGMDSWTCFDYLLENIQVVGTPGAGFGENGKNYFRLTSFGTYESTVEAMNRFKKLFAK